MNSKLIELGLNDSINNEFLEGYNSGYLGRIVAEFKGLYKVATEKDDIFAEEVAAGFLKDNNLIK